MKFLFHPSQSQIFGAFNGSQIEDQLHLANDAEDAQAQIYLERTDFPKPKSNASSAKQSSTTPRKHWNTASSRASAICRFPASKRQSWCSWNSDSNKRRRAKLSLTLIFRYPLKLVCEASARRRGHWDRRRLACFRNP